VAILNLEEADIFTATCYQGACDRIAEANVEQVKIT
jgi:hypothetical protein